MSEFEEMPPLEDEEDSTQGSTSQPVQNQVPVLQPEIDNAISCGNDSDQDDDGWEEMEQEEEKKCKSLFSDTFLTSISQCLNYMKNQHKFDLAAFVKQHNLDQIQYIKMVNYVRRNNPSTDELLQMQPSVWNGDENMKPMLDEDPLLMHDVEDFGCTDKADIIDTKDSESPKNVLIEELQEVVSKQKEALHRLLGETEEKEEMAKTVGEKRLEEDEGYFNSYAHFDIHLEMLSDKVRTESYRDALLKNSSQLSGKRVLDLGCGTGILSMFAAKAGADVTGIDMSEVIYHAMDIIKENKMEKSIKLCKGRLEDIDFEEKFDFIVSEWMGYFLLFEGMLDSVLYARDKHLNPGGLLLPNRCTMHICAMEDIETYEKLIKFWDNVYEFKMSCMRKEVIKEASTVVVKSENIITSSGEIADFNLMTISPADTEFTKEFNLKSLRDGQITAFVGYFDTFFDMENPIQFSTGPHVTPTHWKQTVFYLPEPFKVKEGQVVEGVISVRRKYREVRSLDVSITIEGTKHSYLVE
ncbi:unnamed protein product [Meganyctiphanes norvegica]|uniref:type I protein arginine methyltransferase n=1 Tax=Meganyctiphanes norvegica TaxID=48144 RepID=A0AAV2RJ92_MEGNR